jgi:hypothetical protein
MDQTKPLSANPIILSFLAGACFTAVGFFGYQYLQARNHTVKYNLPTPVPTAKTSAASDETVAQIVVRLPNGWTQAKTPINKTSIAEYVSTNNCRTIRVERSEETTLSPLDYIVNAYNLEKNPSLYNIQYNIHRYSALTIPGLNMEEISNTLIRVDAHIYIVTITVTSQQGYPTCKSSYDSDYKNIIESMNFPANSGLLMYQNSIGNFSFEYPTTWSMTGSSSENAVFNTPLNNTIHVSGVEDASSTIAGYLEKMDRISSTAYEGLPSVEVKATKKTVINGLNCIQREEYLVAADLTQTTTYFKNGSIIVSLSLVPTSGNPPDNDKLEYERMLSTFDFE